jgi:hypothetical protein
VWRRWRWQRWVVRVAVPQKGGNTTGLAASAELADEIAQGAVSEPELATDVGQGTPLQEEGTQGLVVALLRLRWIAEKLLTVLVVHDRPSQVSRISLVENCPKS